MQFFKMQNCGNDYIFVFNRPSPRQIVKLCNRNFGIGGDGVVYFYKKGNYYGYEIYNSDASRATFCGSVTLALGLYLYKKEGGKKYKIITDAGVKTVEIYDTESGIKVGVEVGRPRFYYQESSSDKFVYPRDINVKVNGEKISLNGSVVSVGNLHLVINELYNQTVREQIVQEINKRRVFKKGINIEFAKLNGKRAKVIVYERGSGKTLCCSSGGAATFAYFYKNGKTVSGLNLDFEGGTLRANMRNGKVWVYSYPKFLFYGNWGDL